MTLKDQYRGYELDSSGHGVDIFKDGAWVATITRTSASTDTRGEEAWINRGKKFVDENLAEAGQRVNEQRVARAAAALQAYIDFEDDDPDESYFRDLLTDLHHLLRDRNPALTAGEVQTRFMCEVASAAGHFEAEADE